MNKYRGITGQGLGITEKMRSLRALKGVYTGI
jgi:hypothetical protein